jgi:hypothetical protein
MYPMPNDMAAFERAYTDEHIPMAAPIFQAAGATKQPRQCATGSRIKAVALNETLQEDWQGVSFIRAASAGVLLWRAAQTQLMTIPGREDRTHEWMLADEQIYAGVAQSHALIRDRLPASERVGDRLLLAGPCPCTSC